MIAVLRRVEPDSRRGQAADLAGRDLAGPQLAALLATFSPGPRGAAPTWASGPGARELPGYRGSSRPPVQVFAGHKLPRTQLAGSVEDAHLKPILMLE